LAFGGTQGFTGTVALTCSDTVQSSSCTDSPTSISLNGATAVQSTVTVSTTARSMVAPGTRLRLPRVRTPLPHASPLLWWLVLALGLALAGAACTVRLGGRRSLIAHSRTSLLHARRSGPVRPIPLRLGFAAALLLLLLGVALSMPACGGGGGAVSHAGTPAGTYTVTVTATATSGTASLTHKTTLTLIVQ
jgi:hypothetical protein